MRWITLLSAIIGSVLVLMAGCTSNSSSQEHKTYTPHIDPSEFTTTIDNEYFPMKPGTTFIYEGKGERDQMSVTHDTKKVMGVECVVVDDRAWEDGKLIEQTYDWFAQDKEGTVWYFGEDTKEYEDGKVVSTKGSWEDGVILSALAGMLGAVGSVAGQSTAVGGDKVIDEVQQLPYTWQGVQE